MRGATAGQKIVTIELHAHQAAYEQGHVEEVRLARQESELLDEPAKFAKDEDPVIDERDFD